MAVDIDWIARLRTAPSEACPGLSQLQEFVRSPEAVAPDAFAHIIRGCSDCRTKLQELVLHPDKKALERYLRYPDGVDEDTLFHCMTCEVCKARVREILHD